MPLIILLPVLLLLVAQGLTPELALFQLLPFPQTSYLALISVLLLALLLRQTEWLYWLGILATHYSLTSSTNLTAAESAVTQSAAAIGNLAGLSAGTCHSISARVGSKPD